MALMRDNAFARKVYEVVRMIPEGYVSTYGDIAKLVGSPGAARAVGNALHVNPDPDGTPCFRIVNSKGMLSKNFAFGGMREQRRRLEEDGIEVINYKVDLEVYRWSPEWELISNTETNINPSGDSNENEVNVNGRL